MCQAIEYRGNYVYILPYPRNKMYFMQSHN